MLDQNWEGAALDKFFRLSSNCIGLIATSESSNERVNALIKTRHETEKQIETIKRFMSTTSGDNNISHRQLEEAERELKRIAAALLPAVASRAQINQKITAAGALVNTCGALMVKLGLLNAEEV